MFGKIYDTIRTSQAVVLHIFDMVDAYPQIQNFKKILPRAHIFYGKCKKVFYLDIDPYFLEDFVENIFYKIHKIHISTKF